MQMLSLFIPNGPFSPPCHGSQYGLQRILGDERSLLLLARAIDPKQTNMMTEIVKILSAFCIIGEENM